MKNDAHITIKAPLADTVKAEAKEHGIFIKQVVEERLQASYDSKQKITKRAKKPKCARIECKKRVPRASAKYCCKECYNLDRTGKQRGR